MPFSLRTLAALIFMLLCLVPTAPAQSPVSSFGTRRPLRTGDAAGDLYAAILDSAESASGTLQVGLSSFEGRTSSRRFGQAGIWRVEPGTMARIEFSLRGETWEKLIFDLSEHPITLQLGVDTPTPGQIRIAKITYGRDGAVRDLYAPGGALITGFVPRGSSSGTSIGFYSDLLSNIKVAAQMSAVLAGKKLSSGPFIFSSVKLLEDQGDGMSMKLRPMATLPLGGQISGRCDPDLTFTQNVPVLWHALSYESSSGHLEATIGNFVTGLAGGCIAAGGTELRIVSGTQLNVAGLEFGQFARGRNSHISLRANSFNGGLSAGSAMVLGSVGGNKTLLTAGQGGTLQADSLEIGVQESGNSLLTVGNARVHLSGVSGELAFDAADFVKFAAMTSDVALTSAIWVDTLAPQAKGSFAPSPLTIASGLLSFSPVNRLALETGSATAGRLAIDTSGSPQVTGSFLAADVKIAAGSSLGTAGKFSLQLGTGGDLQVRGPDQLTFSSGTLGAQGRVTASAPVAAGEIDFDGNAKLPIVSGQVQVLLTVTGSGLSGKMGGLLGIGAGMVPLAGTTPTAVSQGSVRFDALNYTNAAGPSGPLTALTLSLSSSGSAALSSSFAIRPTTGSTLESAISGPPTAISAAGVIGGLQLHAGFSTGLALFAAGATFALAGGHLDGTLVRATDGSITGTFGLSTDVNGGLVPLDSLTTLPIGSGSHLAGTQLQLNADGRISGALTTAHFVLTSGQTLV